MKKIIILCIIALFLTSCQYSGILKKEQIKIPAVHEGTQGVTLEFLQNAPPPEIYEDRLFQIMIQVRNAGATDIRGGMLVLSVAEQQISMETGKDQRYDLEGKSVYNPEGSREIKEYLAKTRLIMPSIKSQTTPITASTCYPYQTKATALACIDTDLAGIVKTKPCRTSKITLSGGQGAPIAVTSVEPKMTPHQDPEKIIPEFHIKIRNLGKGQAMTKDKVYQACTGTALGQESWDRVEISATLSDKKLNCKPEKARLTEDTAIICTLEEGIDKTKGTYISPLSIETDYGYITSIVKNIEIKKLMTK